MLKFIYIALLAHIFAWSKNRLDAQGITPGMIANAKGPLDIIIAQRERSIWVQAAKKAKKQTHQETLNKVLFYHLKCLEENSK